MKNSPIPSSPTHPPKYIMYIDKDGKDLVVGYTKCYAAAKVVDLLLEDGEEYDYIDKDKDIIVTASGVTIRSSRLEEIIEYKYTREEDKWESEKEITQNVQYILYGEADEKMNLQINKKTTTKKKIPRHAEQEYKGIPEIARAIQKTPQKTRQLLRKIMPKPDYGWKFKEEEFNTVIKQLQKAK